MIQIFLIIGVKGYKEYSPNGAIFMAKPHAYLERKHFFGSNAIAYIMNKVESVDIDDKIDYELAKILLTERENGKL